MFIIRKYFGINLHCSSTQLLGLFLVARWQDGMIRTDHGLPKACRRGFSAAHMPKQHSDVVLVLECAKPLGEKIST